MNTRRALSVSVFAFGFIVFPATSLSAPQNNSSAEPQAPAKQTFTLSGKVSEKGALLICEKDKKTYRVLNSDTLRHLEGEYVTLKARYLPAKGQLYITAVRSLSAATPAQFPKWDDAAFRR
jgi:hypothetical protein